MISATVTFAGRLVRIDGPEPVIGLARVVLAHHEVPRPAAPDATLTCAVAPGGAPATMSGEAGRRTWTLPADILDGGANWFFYYGFAKALHVVWADLGLIAVHGGLLVDCDDTAVLVVGHRHDGKSSTAAGWLDEGGRLAGDDTALMDMRCDPPLFSGLLREMHLDRELAALLPGLDGVADAEPYLPGRPRVGYDWAGRFPGQVMAKPVSISAVVRTRVDRTRETSARPLPAGSGWDVVRSTLEADPGVAEAIPAARRHLGRLTAWEVTWGPDIWTSRGKHLGFLRRLLGAAG
ncbi:hypothetical protein [Actinoplanes couchii]|uniref:HPr kinase n=1 Tax=Actinoplanes couchii TaxID=403638 RepID=A0ABQ3XSH9_9ACTN|nr:hypothetical protein [Actinoplanes couchii]MDR6315935.1 hypothetical protein [Actinoplanes couchii]GID61415.1 hypothetical protein Aco03nite_098190 [Actinoplanes couchii]